MVNRRLILSISSDRSLEPQKPNIAVSSYNLVRDNEKTVTPHISFFTYIQSRWAKFSELHKCSLLEKFKEINILKEVVDSGAWILFRRWLKKIFMVNKQHPFTNRVFKSQSDVRREEVRHLLNYSNMIHPFSIACLHWEFLFSIINIIYIFHILSNELHYLHSAKYVKWLKVAFDMIMTFNIIITFWIGYWDKECMFIEMKQKRVAIYYFKTYCIWDIISCIPSYCYIFNYLCCPIYYLSLLKWFSLFRLVRLGTISRSLDMFRRYWNLPIELYATLEICLRSAFAIIACTFIMAFLKQYHYFFINVSKEADNEMAKQVIFETVLMMLGVGISHPPSNTMEAVSQCFVMGFSLLLSIWIMAKLFILWQRFLYLAELGEEQFQDLDGYVKYKGLPLNIRNEIYCYYEYQFQRNYYDETAIINELPDNLKAEIPNYKIDRSFERIRFFRLLPNPLIMSIVANVQHVYACPGDIIFRVNTRSSSLYFIKKGTMALHDQHDVEICHLEDGSFYGDIAVVLKQQHSVTMTAISPSKIIVLRHKVLKEILSQLPLTIQEKVYELSRNLLMNRKSDWVLNPTNAHRNVTLLERNRSHRSLERTFSSSKNVLAIKPVKEKSITDFI